MNEVQAKKIFGVRFCQKIRTTECSGYGISKKYVVDEKNRESLFSF